MRPATKRERMRSALCCREVHSAAPEASASVASPDRIITFTLTSRAASDVIARTMIRRAGPDDIDTEERNGSTVRAMSFGDAEWQDRRAVFPVSIDFY